MHRLEAPRPGLSRRRLPARVAVALLFVWAVVVSAIVPATALAQDNSPPPDRGDVSNPRGASGGIIKTPPDQGPNAPAKVTDAKPKAYVPPEYPAQARSEGITGEVILELVIDPQGHVKAATVVQPGGHGFDEAAVAAAKKIEFDPARTADGQPVEQHLLYRYTFSLADQAPQPGDEANTTQNLRGVVLAAGADAPLAAVVVTLAPEGSTPGQEITISTDAEGRFSFDGLAAGSYSVSIQAPGFESLTVREDLAAAETREVKYRLDVKGEGIEVTIRGKRPPREVVKRTITKREIDRIPGTNGDALRSIQNLPGVARPPGIAGLLLVRGSGPQDTQTSIDGTYVPLIYHFGGLSSVVPTEILDKIDFYPGNFATEYGRVMGGIVDVALRSPKEDGYHGLLQLDLIDARGLFEGPIPGTKGWTFLVAARRSYIDAWLGPVLEAAGAAVTQAPVYYDYQILAEHNSAKVGRFRVGFFGSDDRLKLLIEQAPGDPGLSGSLGLVTAFQRLQMLYENEIGERGKFRAVAALGRDELEFSLGPFFFTLNAETLSGRFEYSHRLLEGVTVNVGTDLIGGASNVNLRLPSPPRPGEPPEGPFSTRKTISFQTDTPFFFPGFYADFEIVPTERVRLVPGVRFDYSSFNNKVDVSPRLVGRFDIVHDFPRSTLKVGVGLFMQPPQFQQVVPPLGTAGLESNRAVHYALGYEQEFTRHLEASVEGFVKQLDNLVVGVADVSGLGTKFTNAGSGYVVGGEFLLKYKPDERFFGWVAYTLSRSVRQNGPGEPEYLVSFDQTHILTILGSVQLGHGWEFGARYRLVSGNLTTPNVCNPFEAGCDQKRTNGLFFAPSGTYTPIPLTQQNTERLPLFHQLDIRVDKRWKFKKWQLSAYLDVQNVYNHQSAEAIGYNFDFTARQYVNGLPILPSIGVRADF